VILIDTHIWVWYVQADPRLTAQHQGCIATALATGLGVSVMSCLEVARLVAGGKLLLPVPIEDWVRAALRYPGVRLLPFTPDIAVASTRLPGLFHKDPADRILVATAIALNIPILTADTRILAYPYVRCLT
jgi:PIN domain nuclease of toxin-antitoxin system